MVDSLEYAKMSEIPVSSCEISVESKKSKKKDAKSKVINKVNKNLDGSKKTKKGLLFSVKNFFKARSNKLKDSQEAKASYQQAEVKEKKGFDVVSAQVITIFVLVIAILLTNVFWEESAINVFFKNVFNKEQTVALEYTDFNATLPMTEVEVLVQDGVMTASGEGAVYTTVGGEVESVELLEDGTYAITVAHTDKFKTVLEGVNYPYFEKGSAVYTTCPIGYASKTLTVKMYNSGELITNYSCNNGAIVWE